MKAFREQHTTAKGSSPLPKQRGASSSYPPIITSVANPRWASGGAGDLRYSRSTAQGTRMDRNDSLKLSMTRLVRGFIVTPLGYATL